MSTKISALDERIKADIIGDEFFPIIDGGIGSNTATTNYQTYKIKLDTLFASGQGHEKVTDLIIAQGEHETDTAVVDGVQLNGNEFFTLQYTQEDGNVQTRTIQKYKLQDDDVEFRHIDPAGYINSTQRISNNNTNQRLTTPAAVIEHVDYKEDLLFDNSNSKIKVYYGDSTTARGNSATHILNDFRLNSEVADDFANLLDGVKPELNTFKKIEEEFDLTTVDRNTKIGTDQVNLNHFRINTEDDSNRLNIKDSGIVTNLIGSNAITSVKIRDNAVLTSKIVNNAITTNKIIKDAVTTDKIIDEAVTPAKLSGSAVTPPLSPSWDETAVNIPRSLSVSSDINAGGDVSLRTTLSIYNSDSRGVGDSHEGRALVHTVGDKLTINHLQDFTGGVNIRGTVVVPDQSVTAVRSNPRGVATKEYVDDADIRIRPLDPSRIQDDCIQLRHMSPDSVDTEELFDFCVTDPKVELIGPHWDDTGTVRIYNDLNVAGNKLEVGEIGTTVGDKTEITLRSPTSSLNRGIATITRLKGDNANLSIKNTRGNITFNTGSSDDLTLTSTRALIPKTLTVGGTGSTSIDGTNFGNPALLIGDNINGVAIDQDEIVQKGGNLHIGVAASSQNIVFRSGTNTLATISGNTANFSAVGDIISETGVIRRNGDTADLTLRGGTTNANGAHIKLYGVNNAANSNHAEYKSDLHSFGAVSGAASTLIIDAKSRRVRLVNEGSSPDNLITKNYVDTKKIAPSDLTDGGPLWQSNGMIDTRDSLFIKSWEPGISRETVGVYTRNIYGRNANGSDLNIPEQSKLRLKASHGGGEADDASIVLYATDHPNQNQVVIRGKQTQVQTIAGAVALDVQEDGRVLVPLQTQDFVKSDRRAVATREYVLSKQAETFPDNAYVLRNGTNGMNFGDLTWNNQQGYGLSWDTGVLQSSIKFHVEGGDSLNNRLEFNIGDKGTENFLFTYTNTANDTFELLKVGQLNLSYKGYTIWHDGNKTMPSLAPYAKTAALSAYSLKTHKHDNDYAAKGHTHSQYALTSHTHSQYASSSRVTALETAGGAAVAHNGTSATTIRGCSVTRTSAGKYTITLHNSSGRTPVAVASLAGGFSLIELTATADAGKMNGQFSISATTGSNTKIYIQIAELVALRGSAGGNDSNTASEFVRTNVDAPFQVIINN